MNNMEKKSSGFNWGWGIFSAIVLGALAMIYLVYKASQVETSMVMKDYYEEEVFFEDMLNAQARTKALATSFEYFQTDDVLILQFPKECLTYEISEGEVQIYRPSSSKDDVILPMDLDEDAQIVLNKNELLAGTYIVKANWYMDNERYNISESIRIKK